MLLSKEGKAKFGPLGCDALDDGPSRADLEFQAYIGAHSQERCDGLGQGGLSQGRDRDDAQGAGTGCLQGVHQPWC